MKKICLSIILVLSLIITSLSFGNSVAVYSASSINENLSDSIIGTNAELASVGTITYSVAGTYNTTGGKSIPLYSADREYTTAEKNSLKNAMASYMSENNITASLISPASAKYNCHSFAWYDTSYSNPYWIDSPDIRSIFSDSTCTRISSSSVAVNDIIVYYNSNFTEALHSGVVHSITNGTVKIKSKWGPYGVYLHTRANVPDDYKDKDDHQLYTRYYRYHYYTRKYTGENYHSGSKHYYQFADVCNLCGSKKNASYVQRACSGPPCVIPYSLAHIK